MENVLNMSGVARRPPQPKRPEFYVVGGWRFFLCTPKLGISMITGYPWKSDIPWISRLQHIFIYVPHLVVEFANTISLLTPPGSSRHSDSEATKVEACNGLIWVKDVSWHLNDVLCMYLYSVSVSWLLCWFVCLCSHLLVVHVCKIYWLI